MGEFPQKTNLKIKIQSHLLAEFCKIDFDLTVESHSMDAKKNELLLTKTDSHSPNWVRYHNTYQNYFTNLAKFQHLKIQHSTVFVL